MSKVFNMVGGGGGPAASIFVTGLSETDTVTATKGTKTLIGKWTQKLNPVVHGLPNEYTELEYIESTGTQYIDTLIVPTAKYKLEAEFSYVGNPGDETAFGVWDDSGSMFFSFYNNRWYFGNGSGGQSYIPATNVNGEKHVVINNNSNEVVLNGDIVGTLANGVYSNSITLFARKYNGNINTKSKLKLKEFICFNKETDSFVCKFVPCKRNSDSTIGLYDLVSGTFFENSGTGEFVAGPEVPQTFDGFLIKSIRDFGTWIVTATNGEKTATQDVLVDVITEYEIEMNLTKLYLYRYNDLCEDITGGWSKAGWNFGQYVGDNPSFEDDCMNFYVTTLNKNVNAGTQLAVSFADYSKLRLDIISNSSAGAFMIRENRSDSSTKEVNFTSTNSVRQVVDIDISDLSGNYFFGLMNWSGDVGYGVKIYRVWLE